MTHRVFPAGITFRMSAIALAFAALTGCQQKVSTSTIAFVSPAKVSEQLAKDPSKHLILDARNPEAFMEGRIPGARRITVPEIDSRTRNPNWERFGSIVVYGENPGSLAAEAVTKRLMTAGYEQVYLLDGGFDAWVASGRPVQR